MIKLFIAQNKSEKKLIKNTVDIQYYWTGEGLVVEHTLTYPYPGISSDRLTVSFGTEGLNPNVVYLLDFFTGEKRKTHLFKEGEGYPTRIFVVNINQNSDSMYEYVAGLPRIIPENEKRDMIITSLVSGISRIDLSANCPDSSGFLIESDLSFTYNLKIVYDTQEKRYMTVNGSMKKHTKSSVINFAPPVINGAIAKTVIIESGTVTPTSDAMYNYNLRV